MRYHAYLQLVRRASRDFSRTAVARNNPVSFLDPDGLDVYSIEEFWVTFWLPGRQAFVPGDMLASMGSSIGMGRPGEATGFLPRQNDGRMNVAHNMAVVDASDGPMCPPSCSQRYVGHTSAYALMADITINLTNSSTFKVDLWEQAIPNTGSMCAPGGNTRWSSAILGPPADEFGFHVLQGSLKSLSDGELDALGNELNKQIQERGLDPVLSSALTAVIFEQVNRKKDEKAVTKCGDNDLTKCGAMQICGSGGSPGCQAQIPDCWSNTPYN
jgi:hypothetical protein